MLLTQIIILILLVFLSAFFSGIETALISLNMIKVKSFLKQKKKGAEALFRLKQKPNKLIITILIGNNLVNIGAASFATVVFTDLFGSSGLGIATGIMTFLILVFGEITPKTFAAQNAEKVSLLVARPIEILSYIFTPFIFIFGGISRFITNLFGPSKKKELSEEELRIIVTMGEKEGLLSKEVAEMMHNVLKFEGTRVTQIMTPKLEIDMLNGNFKLKRVINFITKSPYSRFPVYSKSKDKIIGIVDVDDVLKYVKNNRLEVKVRKLIKPVYFVSEKEEIDDLLGHFEGRHVPMAIVLNKNKKVSGLVTVEDILEEIVGDIFDKSRERSADIKKISNKMAEVDAKASMEKVNKVLKLGLKEKHFDTIASFIEHKLKRIPKKGEKIKLKEAVITIDRVDKNSIRRVKIIKN